MSDAFIVVAEARASYAMKGKVRAAAFVVSREKSPPSFMGATTRPKSDPYPQGFRDTCSRTKPVSLR